MRYYTSIFVKGLQSYHKSKLEFGKNICRSAWFEPMCPGSAELVDIFSELQLWSLVSLLPLDQNQFLVPHLKDLFHICLETKAQGFWMTFKLCNLGSKWPHLHRAYVLRVSNNLGSTVCVKYSGWIHKILVILNIISWIELGSLLKL